MIWRIALLALTVQPVPTNDSFSFDGPVINWLTHGHYYNPSLSVVFPISGTQVFSAYPPLYQLFLLFWMTIFGTTVISAMAFHVTLFAIAGFVTLKILENYFPANPNYGLVSLLFLAVTFDDRPEGLAHIFGLLALLGISKLVASDAKWAIAATSLAFIFAFYTSIIVATLYFGIGLIAVVIACLNRPKIIYFLPFLIAAFMFAAITLTIAKNEPLLWAGFLENARQTPLRVMGFHKPYLREILKLVRNAPVFFLAILVLPSLYKQRKELINFNGQCLALLTGIFLMGWILLGLAMILFTPNYVIYILFIQILLAGGILSLADKILPCQKGLMTIGVAACVVLVSVRSVGMSTWGVACAWKNSYWKTHECLMKEFAPFAETNSTIVVSSALLYVAAEANVRKPVQADWYFDRANWTNNADLNGFIRLRPRKLVLVQYDYYQDFVPLLKRLRDRQRGVLISVHDLSQVKTPDSIPFVCHVLQYISWAPVIVDLKWENDDSVKSSAEK